MYKKKTYFPLVLLCLIIVTACDGISKEPITTVNYVVYIDSFVFNDAVYIDNVDSLVKFENIGPDSILTTPICNTVVFADDSISIKYIGGWRNPASFVPDLAEDYDYSENVIIDTIYEKRVVDVSYAIFEVHKAKEVFRDTALLDMYKYYKAFQESSIIQHPDYFDKSEYLRLIHAQFGSWKLADNGSFYRAHFDEAYYAVPTEQPNKWIYFIDIYPYWPTRVSAPELVFFHNP